MTLRDASHKKLNPWGKALGGCFVCLAPARSFPAADKAAVSSHLSSGTEFEFLREL